MYDQDPISVGALPLDIKKRTLKVRIHTYGHVSPDPSAIGSLSGALPIPSPAREFVTRLTTPSDDGVAVWIYCVVPAQSVGAFEGRSLAYLRNAVGNRLVPYFQYTNPRNVLNLAMQALPGFHRHMYCQITALAPQIQYGPPGLQLMDTRGRRDARPVAQVNCVGLIREEQRQRALWRNISNGINGPQQLRLVASSWPALRLATRAFGGNSRRPAVPESTDRALYLGVMNAIHIKEDFYTDRPQVGAIVLISCLRRQANGKWARTGESFIGIVLQLAQADLDVARGKFVFGLWIQSQSLRQNTVRGLANATLESVSLSFITNTKKDQAHLQALRQFNTQLTIPTITSLHVNVLFSAQTVPQTRRDLRHGPSAPLHNLNELNSRAARFSDAVQDLRNLAQMANLAQNEIGFLTQVPAQLNGFYRFVRASVQQESFRSVLALALSLTNTVAPEDAGRKKPHQIVLVVDNSEDRSKICYDIHRLLRAARANGRNRGELWWRTKMVSWSVVEIAHQFTPPPRDHDSIRRNLSDDVHPFREQLELLHKLMFSDLSQHSAALDQTGAYHNAPSNIPPPDHTPFSMSMGDAKQTYFLHRQQERQQYYQDRAHMLNNTPGSVDDIHQIVQRCHMVDQRVLGEMDVLVTDSATAMSDDVKAAFPTPVIIYVNAQAATFPEAAGVFMAYPKMEAAFVIGDQADQRHPPQFASGPEWNEAWLTYRRSLMTMMQNANADCFLL